jgi:3',5'-nucleoside bisphosphate phosphatase
VPIYRAEIHVHTVLSPCAENEMIPPLIVAAAKELEINLIAITDHNASANVEAVQKAARNSGVTVLPGMELQTREEVHVICLFDTLEQLGALQTIVDDHLPGMENDIEHFGEQFVVDETGVFLRREQRLLITSTNLSIEEAFQRVNEIGGIAIPAHVDRKAFGLIANLGIIPEDLPVEALEISRHVKITEVSHKIPQLRGYPLIQSGDVHRLEEFLGVNRFQMEAPTISEIRKALRGQDGRKLTTSMEEM